MYSFLEFFAGGGMARAGLGPGWRCLFANDNAADKAAAYRANWGDGDLALKDVGALSADDVPGDAADLAWASFPCQDLSLAGARGGLAAARSSAFWPFWRLLEDLDAQDRAPRIVVLENVAGLLTSNGGADFGRLADTFAKSGRAFGAAVIDAAHFTPQSRPRLFIVAFPAEAMVAGEGHDAWTPPALAAAVASLRGAAKRAWQPLPLPAPPLRNTALKDIVEQDPAGVDWHCREKTEALLALMSPRHREKVDAARRDGFAVGAVFRRSRPQAEGGPKQRAEVRFDGLAGCLRTPAGGSSRQTLLFLNQGEVRSRLLSPREAARLMGLDDSYVLPERTNSALKLLGDGVAAPAVRFLARHVLEPLADNARQA